MADPEATEAARKRRVEALRAGLARVNALEPVGGTVEDLEKRIDAEYARFGAKRPELEE